MGVEIEHKFLVKRELLPRKLPPGKSIEQGFLCSEPVVRVRLVRHRKARGTREAFLTIKGRGLRVRAEFEYPIPHRDARELLKLCGARTITKIRRELGPFEVDEFKGRHKGLWLAELELKSARAKLPKLPAWIGKEVTGEKRYANVNLAGPDYSPQMRIGAKNNEAKT
jgi:adenylate cyclase